LAYLDKTEELLAGNVGVRPIRHRGSKVLGGLEAQAAAVLRMRKISECRGQERDGRRRRWEGRVPNQRRRAVLKGAGVAPHLQH
jgi:hypothetical protein